MPEIATYARHQHALQYTLVDTAELRCPVQVVEDHATKAVERVTRRMRSVFWAVVEMSRSVAVRPRSIAQWPMQREW